MNNELFSRLKDLAQKENRTRLAVLLGAAAMLLILLSELFTPSEKTAAASAAPADDNVYRQQLEQQLSDLIAQVEGAGKTTVMITLESAGETVYARDEQSDTQTTQDGSDGVTDRKESYKSEHIIVDAADGKQPLVETHIEPEVKGVAVVCEGGDDITVIKRITDLVSVVLGLSTNRICVTKMI